MVYELLKDFCISNNIEIRFNEPMSKHVSLRIGGMSDIAIFPDETNIAEVIGMLVDSNIPYIVIGGGTNILIRDKGIEGAVIFTKRINKITDYPSSKEIYAQAGASLQGIINLCVEKGLSGIEGLAGIPGSIGGAIAGNAGSFGYEIKDVIKSIDILIKEVGIRTLMADQIVFSYRKADIPVDAVILSARLRFKEDEPNEVKKRVSEFIKEKKSRQPVSEASAGCVFKNPRHIAAGRLIDEAGCKGMRVGGIEVSSLHANFFINTGEGTADDFLMLMDKVSKRVKDRFGIVLEPEIKIYGRDS